ncbi:nucleotide exchange factor GrpE [Candidatus Woesearchaeota archaeon]|nr:nucleotide exchange factor GrpE [Candidatus Woesearchaeota archaeon]
MGFDTKNEDLQTKLDEQQKVIDDYTNILKRLQADFENYIKRVEKEREEFANYSNHKLVAKLLNIVDDFEKALDVTKENKEIANGIEMIYKQLNKILQEEDVVAMNAIGEKLDPFKHEVIDIVNGDENDVVVEELQKGYILKNKVLRPSKVRISKCGGKE